MASSLSSAAANIAIQERASQFSVGSFSVALPRQTLHKEVLGTALFSHNTSLCENPRILQKTLRRLNVVEAAKRVDNKRSFILNSTLVAQQENVEKVAKLCEDVRQWATDKKKDKAAGVKQFDCYVDLYDKNVFHFMEEYCSVLHMNDFRASPEHTKFTEEVRPLLLEPIALSVYELRDGQLGTMLNPIGPKGEGGLDDATGQAGRGGEQYMKPKHKPKRRRSLEDEIKMAQAAASKLDGGKEEQENKWSFDKIVARVLGQASKTDSESAEEQWSLRSLFGRKK